MTQTLLSLVCRPFSLESLDNLSVEALALTLFEDDRPLKGAAGFCDWRLNGRLSHMLQAGSFIGKPMEVMLTNTRKKIGTDRIFLFGQGTRKDMNLELFENRIHDLLYTIKKAHLTSFAIELPGLHPGPLSLPQAIPTFLDVATSLMPETEVTLLCPLQKGVNLVAEIASKDHRVNWKTQKQ